MRYGYFTRLEEVIYRMDEDVERDVIEMTVENLATQRSPGFAGETVYRKGKENYGLKATT